jgi:hypothetical protein
MQDEKALALFKEVLTKTQKGRIPWEPGVSDDALIAAIKGKYSLVLREDQARGWAITLTMRDQRDREILTVGQFLDGMGSSDLRTLYDAARRQAYKVDKTVDDFISDLQSL